MEFVVQNGDSVTWFVRVGNTSNFTTASNTVANLIYPPGLIYSSHYVPQGSFVSGTGVWTVGSVFPQQIIQMSITFTVSNIALAPFTLNANVSSPAVETTYIDNTTLNTVYSLCTVASNCVANMLHQYVCEEFSPLVGQTSVTTVNTSAPGYDDTVFRNGDIQNITEYSKAGNVYTFVTPFGTSTNAQYSEKIKICKFI